MSIVEKTSELADQRLTVEILKELPGGPELLDWFGGDPNFGDSEVIGLSLDRLGPSWLRMAMCKLDQNSMWQTIVVTLTLKDQIDVSIEGFSHQNVIGDFVIRRAREGHLAHQNLIGVGIAASEHEIELEPCAGSFGTIRATISSISFEARDDAFLWQRRNKP